MRTELWANVHTERARLVDDLAGRPDVDWATPSLCAGWNIRDVVAHLAATATLSLWKFAGEFLRAGFSANRIVDRQVAAARKQSAGESLDALRLAIRSTASPPQPTITRVIEIVVHGEDIRRPLQIDHDYLTTHIDDALRYLARDRFSGATNGCRDSDFRRAIRISPSGRVTWSRARRCRCCLQPADAA